MSTKRPSLAESMKRLDPPSPSAAPAVSAAPSAPVESQAPADQAGQGRGYFAATRVGRKKVTAALEPEAHKQLKRLALDQGHTVEDLLREAVSDLFRKYHKPPIA